jgi:cobalt-zinc-cadmium efflux system membrane fusion protein
MKPRKKQIILVIVILELSTVLGAIMIHDSKIPKGKTPNLDNDEPVLALKHDDSGKPLGSVTLTAAELKSFGLHIDTIAAASIGKTIELPGEIALDTNQQTLVSTPAAGRVLQVLVKTGQAVKRGQTLAILMSHELTALQSRVAAAKAHLTVAQINLDRDRALWKRGVTNQQDLLQTDNLLKQAQIEYQNLNQQLKAYGDKGTSHDGRILITAPVDGHVADKDLTVGATVQPGIPLFTLAHSDELWVEFNVPPALSNQIGIGMSVKVQSEDAASLSATIRGFSSVTEGQARHLVARAHLDKLHSGLSPDVLVTVRFTEQNKAVHYAVKSNAIQTINQKSVIFVVDGTPSNPTLPTISSTKPLKPRLPTQTTFNALTVKLGRVDPKGYSELQTPLKVGTQYVSAGSFKLRAELQEQMKEETDKQPAKVLPQPKAPQQPKAPLHKP